MSSVLPTDKVLVQRAATLHSAPADMSTVQDTDLLLINRAGVDYKCSVADWKASQASINKPRMLTPANGAGQSTSTASSAITKVETVMSPDYSKDLFESGGTWDPARPLMNAFDGDDTKFAYVRPNGGSEAILFDPQRNSHPIHLGATGTFSFKGGNGGATELFDVYINGVNVTAQLTPHPTVAVGWEWYTVPISGGVLNTFKIQSRPGSGTSHYGAVLHGMKINGAYVLAGTPLTKLTLTDATGLTAFAYGDAVTEVGHGNDGRGAIVDVDATAKTMQLSGVTGTWDVGSTVLGAPKLSTDAAVGETPTFTSSAFSATGSVTHASSDWQVTLKTDTAFASPVVQSIADTAHLLSWDGGPLQPNTDYIARVRHNGSGGVVSPWSDAVGFKTKAAFIAVLPASDVVVSADATTWKTVTSPSKFINVCSNYDDFFGFGADGKLYQIPKTGGTATEIGVFAGHIPAGRQVVQGGCGYNGSISLLDNKGGLAGFGTRSYVPDVTKALIALPAAEADLVNTGMGTCDAAVAVSNSLKKVYSFFPTAGAQLTLNGVASAAVAGWKEAPQWNFLFTAHPGHNIKRLVCVGTGGGSPALYGDMGIAYVLYDDGTLMSKTGTVPGTYTDLLPYIIASASPTNIVFAQRDSGEVVRIAPDTGSNFTVTTALAVGKSESCLYGAASTQGFYIKTGHWWTRAGTQLSYKAPPPGTLTAFVPFVSHIAAVHWILPVVP